MPLLLLLGLMLVWYGINVFIDVIKCVESLSLLSLDCHQ